MEVSAGLQPMLFPSHRSLLVYGPKFSNHRGLSWYSGHAPSFMEVLAGLQVMLLPSWRSLPACSPCSSLHIGPYWSIGQSSPFTEVSPGIQAMLLPSWRSLLVCRPCCSVHGHRDCAACREARCSRTSGHMVPLCYSWSDATGSADKRHLLPLAATQRSGRFSDLVSASQKGFSAPTALGVLPLPLQIPRVCMPVAGVNC